MAGVPRPTLMLAARATRKARLDKEVSVYHDDNAVVFLVAHTVGFPAHFRFLRNSRFRLGCLKWLLFKVSCDTNACMRTTFHDDFCSGKGASKWEDTVGDCPWLRWIALLSA